MLKNNLLIGFLLLTYLCLQSCKVTSIDEASPETKPDPSVKTDVQFWLTNTDGTSFFKKQSTSLLFGQNTNSYPTISVDTTQVYQTIDGFGYALTGGSASLINGLEEVKKTQLLKELFLTDSTFIGISYLRISLGASDLSAEPFTYDDMPAGQVDPELQNFSVEREKVDLIPLLKRILVLNPSLKILASPWSAPVWMKTNGSFVGGSLKPEYYDAYTRYFLKYIQTFKNEGIPIDAITIQNEPLNPNNNPSMQMTAQEQASFIKSYLGPKFRDNQIGTKILVYDHNLDHPEYATAILADADANPFVDGSAFHLYAGSISAMSGVHNSYPQKNLYFTEQYTGSGGTFKGDLDWHIKNLIIGATRNWSRNVLEWNLASNPDLGPHTNGGCSTCLGALTIGTSINRNVSYYIIAHASRFVRPGSVRIGSEIVGDLQNVAFKTPDGKKVLIVLNNGSTTSSFNIKWNGKSVVAKLMSGSVGTFVW